MAARLRNTLAALAVLAAGAAAAHQGATGDVKIRMDAMEAMAAEVKRLAAMARGSAPFDPAAAAAAARALAKAAGRIPAQFESREMSDLSEAAPAIWTDWAGFVAEARALEDAARATAAADGPDALGAAFGRIGDTCKSCHADYRIDRD